MMKFNRYFSFIFVMGLVIFSKLAIAEDGHTILSGGMARYTGTKNEGLYQTVGTVIGIKTYASASIISWYSGIEVEFSSGSTYFTNKKRNYSYLSGSLGFGPVINFNPSTKFSPSIEFGPRMGFGNLSISSAPEGVDAQSASAIFGGDATISGRVGKANGAKIVVFMTYRILLANKLASVSHWDLNAAIIGLALGI